MVRPAGFEPAAFCSGGKAYFGKFVQLPFVSAYFSFDTVNCKSEIELANSPHRRVHSRIASPVRLPHNPHLLRVVIQQSY